MQNLINILAILFSPFIAVLVSIYLQGRKELRDRKIHIFLTLISGRYTFSDEDVRALNAIDVIFSENKEVRHLWKEYFELIHQPNRMGEWSKKKLELLKAMADAVGYSRAINHLDLDRIYSPVGLAEDQRKQKELMEELLRVLKQSEGIQFVGKGKNQDDLKFPKEN